MREDTLHLESVFEVGGASTGKTVLVEVGGESTERRITGPRKSRPGGQQPRRQSWLCPWASGLRL